MASAVRDSAGGIADENGEAVQRFASTMHNLGLAKAAEELLEMLKSQRWQEWSQGGMSFRFLPGEFDYFLTQQEVQREDVMAIPDVEAKAALEAAMDERRTGEDGYRRTITDARAQLPALPGRPAKPFGYSRKEGQALGASDDLPTHRPALGSSVRRFRNAGGMIEPRRDERAHWERIAASAQRLPDDEFERLKKEIDEQHRARRKADKIRQNAG